MRREAQLTVLDDATFGRLHRATLDVLATTGVEMKQPALADCAPRRARRPPATT